MNHGAIFVNCVILLCTLPNSEEVQTPPTTGTPAMSKPTTESGLHGNDLIFLITGCSIGGAIIILLCILIFCIHKKQRRSNISTEIGKGNHTLPNNYEAGVFTKQKMSGSSTEMALVNKGYESETPVKNTIPTAAKPLHIGKSKFFAKKPYGDMGEAAASPFVGGSKRLYSISPSPSMEGGVFIPKHILDERRASSSPRSSVGSISIPQHILDERRASSDTVVSNLSPQPRRDSGYVDVNVSHIIKKRLYTSEMKQNRTGTTSPSSSWKQTTLHGSCDPYHTHELKNVKSSRTASESSKQPSSEFQVPELFRHASTGQALDYCKKAKDSLPKQFRGNVAGHKRQPSTDSQYENVNLNAVLVDQQKGGALSGECNNNVGEYLQAVSTGVDSSHVPEGHYSPNDCHNRDQDYEIPQPLVHKTSRQESTENVTHYGNLNAKGVATEYQNFDYDVPVFNPTRVDEEDVYLEFLPDEAKRK